MSERIAFLLGNLEPRGGIADNSRQIAKELIGRQQPCVLISLNDSFVSKPVETNADQSAPELRLPSSMPWQGRIERAADFCNQHKVTLVSMRFVCYAYAYQGIVFGLANNIKPLLSNRRFHLFMDELWVGEHKESYCRHKLVGKLQRASIVSFIKSTSPEVIHVTNGSAISRLARAGVNDIKFAPMSGTIPIVKSNSDKPLFDLLRSVDDSISMKDRESYLFFALFGAIQVRKKNLSGAKEFFTFLEEAESVLGKKAYLFSLGKVGIGGLGVWREEAAAAGFADRFIVFGELEDEQISGALQSMDYGVSTTCWINIGKSSGSIALSEHGLPVIVVRDDYTLGYEVSSRPELDDRFVMLEPGLAQRLSSLARPEVGSTLHKQVDVLSKDLGIRD